MTEELERACASLRSADLEFALLCSDENVAYVSDFDTPSPVSPVAAQAGGLPQALVLVNARDESTQIMVVDVFASSAEEQSALGEPLVFSVFSHLERVDAMSSYLDCVRQALRDAGLTHAPARIGVEFSSLPSALLQMLVTEFQGMTILDAGPSLERARWTKTSREIERLRQAVRVADAGHQAFIDASVRAHTTEFEVWAHSQCRMAEVAGQPIPMVIDLVTGPRTATPKWPGGPISRRTSAGDTGVMDIMVRVEGYWADCCNVVSFAEPPDREQKRCFAAAKDGFDAAVETLRPGVRCCDVDAAVRRALESHGYPIAHYSGHQVGTNLNERPRLVQYETSLVEAGMVFAIESGAYGGRGSSTGARCERVVLVTESGTEVLSQFPWGIS